MARRVIVFLVAFIAAFGEVVRAPSGRVPREREAARLSPQATVTVPFSSPLAAHCLIKL